MSAGRSHDILSFDLDGTLVDTAAEIAEAANRAIEEFGFERRPVEAITRLIGAGTRELMLRLFGQAASERARGEPAIDAEAVLARFAVHYAATAGTTSRPYEGCAEALARLREGGVRLVCLTNKEEHYARIVLRQTGLAGCFEWLIGGDTLAFKKPDRRVIDQVLVTLGARHAAMAHVGDSRTDIETARNAGIAAWAVPWGYNGGEPIETARPDRIFASLGAVADHVLDAAGR
jgi:phosphoglycolate phosphatase